MQQPEWKLGSYTGKDLGLKAKGPVVNAQQIVVVFVVVVPELLKRVGNNIKAE